MEREIPGAPGYNATSHGEIISYHRWKDGRALKQSLDYKDRYPRVTIYYPPYNPVVERVPDLIARTFLPPRPPPPGHFLRHLNDIKTDNRIDNLEWGTNRRNQLDAIENGLNYQSNKTHCPAGHEYTPENTRLTLNKRSGRPGRICKTCSKIRDWARYHSEPYPFA